MCVYTQAPLIFEFQFIHRLLNQIRFLCIAPHEANASGAPPDPEILNARRELHDLSCMALGKGELPSILIVSEKKM